LIAADWDSLKCLDSVENALLAEILKIRVSSESVFMTKKMHKIASVNPFCGAMKRILLAPLVNKRAVLIFAVLLEE
jgi:hypothetical protein